MSSNLVYSVKNRESRSETRVQIKNGACSHSPGGQTVWVFASDQRRSPLFMNLGISNPGSDSTVEVISQEFIVKEWCGLCGPAVDCSLGVNSPRRNQGGTVKDN